MVVPLRTDVSPEDVEPVALRATFAIVHQIVSPLKLDARRDEVAQVGQGVVRAGAAEDGVEDLLEPGGHVTTFPATPRLRRASSIAGAAWQSARRRSHFFGMTKHADGLGET